MSKKRYGAKKRGKLNNDKTKIIEYYSPIIYVNGKETYVSENDEILKFKNKEDALKVAKETYLKFKNKLFL